MDTQVVPMHNRVHQPCAACRMLRRRCDRNCSLAPYFPGEEIEKFAGVHKVFGASNVIKMIQVSFCGTLICLEQSFVRIIIN